MVRGVVVEFPAEPLMRHGMHLCFSTEDYDLNKNIGESSDENWEKKPISSPHPFQ